MERIDEFRNALLVHISELNIEPMVKSLSLHPEELPDMYKLTFDNKLLVSWRALWVCEKLSEVHPGWFVPLREELTGRLLIVHTTVQNVCFFPFSSIFRYRNPYLFLC